MSELLFKPCKSLWKEIELQVPLAEKLSSIKTIVGESLIEETQELHLEISTLVDIWKEKYEKCRVPQSPRVQKDILQQINLFVELLKKKENNRERYWKSILNEADILILDEIVKGGKTDCSTESLDLLSRTVDELVLSVNDLFEDGSTGKLVHTFREHFEDERRFLMKQVQMIQNELIAENKFSYCTTSIADLRRICGKLEHAALSKDIDELTARVKSSLAFLPKPPLQINNTVFSHRRNRLISSKNLPINASLGLNTYSDCSK